MRPDPPAALDGSMVAELDQTRLAFDEQISRFRQLDLVRRWLAVTAVLLCLATLVWAVVYSASTAGFPYLLEARSPDAYRVVGRFAELDDCLWAARQQCWSKCNFRCVDSRLPDAMGACTAPYGRFETRPCSAKRGGR